MSWIMDSYHKLKDRGEFYMLKENEKIVGPGDIKNLKHIEVVKATKRCEGCMLEHIKDGGLVCTQVAMILTGEDCTGIILKKKEVLETCTKENTIAGDTVWHKKSMIVSNVKYIHETDSRFLLDDCTAMDHMEKFEVKLK